MKPALLRVRPARRPWTEALEVLHQRGDDAKVLAGGQSLVPMMNFPAGPPRGDRGPQRARRSSRTFTRWLAMASRSGP